MKNSFSIFSALSNAAQKLDAATIYAFLPIVLLQLFFAVLFYLYKSLTLGLIASIPFLLVRPGFSYFFKLVKTYLGIKRAKNEFISADLALKPLTVNIITRSLLARLCMIPLLLPFLLLALLHIRLYTLVICIAAMAFIIIRLSFIDYFIIDKNLTAFAAIEASWTATNLNFWKLAGALCLSSLMLIGATLTLGIGAIWLVPLIELFYGDMYLQLSNRPIQYQYKPARGLEPEFLN